MSFKKKLIFYRNEISKQINSGCEEKLKSIFWPYFKNSALRQQKHLIYKMSIFKLFQYLESMSCNSCVVKSYWF